MTLLVGMSEKPGSNGPVFFRVQCGQDSASP